MPLHNVSSQRNKRVILTHYGEIKKRAHDSQIGRAKENIKLLVESLWAQRAGRHSGRCRLGPSIHGLVTDIQVNVLVGR